MPSDPKEMNLTTKNTDVNDLARMITFCSIFLYHQGKGNKVPLSKTDFFKRQQ